MTAQNPPSPHAIITEYPTRNAKRFYQENFDVLEPVHIHCDSVFQQACLTRRAETRFSVSALGQNTEISRPPLLFPSKAYSVSISNMNPSFMRAMHKLVVLQPQQAQAQAQASLALLNGLLKRWRECSGD